MILDLKEKLKLTQIAAKILQMAKDMDITLNSMKLNYILYIIQCELMRNNQEILPISFRSFSLGPFSSEINDLYEQYGLSSIPVPEEEFIMPDEFCNAAKTVLQKYGKIDVWTLGDTLKEHYPVSRTSELGYRLLISGALMKEHCGDIA